MADYNIYNKVRARLLLLLTALLLAACSSETGDEPDPVVPPQPAPTDPVEPGQPVAADEDVLRLSTAYMQIMPEEMAGTRAGAPDGYSEYTGETGIALILTSGDEASPAGTVYYTEGQWNSLVNVKVKDYYVYGFMPASLASACTVSPRSGDYTQGVSFEFKSIPPISKDDVCLLTGLLDNSTSGTLRRGQFAFTGKPKGSNNVSLLFDHLFACVRMNMKQGEEYSKLRTIKLKEVKLGTTSVYSLDLNTGVIPNVDGHDPVVTPSIVSTPIAGYYSTVFSSDEGVALKADTNLPIDGYFYPNNDIRSNLAVECRYDVCDTQENVIRQDCVARNSLPVLSLARGRRATINLTIEPTYLYVLSDPDLDNPTVVINKNGE